MEGTPDINTVLTNSLSPGQYTHSELFVASCTNRAERLPPTSLQP